MIFEKTHIEIGRNLRRAIAVDIGDQTRGMCEKILGVEIENGRQPDLAVGGIDPDVPSLSNEAACGRIKLALKSGRAERDTTIRALSLPTAWQVGSLRQT